jgi:hypothetical protein
MKNWAPHPTCGDRGLHACRLRNSAACPEVFTPSPFGTALAPTTCEPVGRWRQTARRSIRQIADFGFRIVRNDLLWADVEDERGFDWSRYDAFVADARHSGLTPRLILEMGSEDVTVAAGARIPQCASVTACSMHNLDLPVPVSIRLTSRPSIEKIR